MKKTFYNVIAVHDDGALIFTSLHTTKEGAIERAVLDYKEEYYNSLLTGKQIVDDSETLKKELKEWGDYEVKARISTIYYVNEVTLD